MDNQSVDLASARLALEEMRLAVEKKWQAADALTTNGYQLLGAAGVVLVLAVTIPGAPTDPVLSLAYWALLGIAFVVYLIMVAIVLTVAQPKNFATGIKADWAVLQDALLQKNELQAVLTLVSTYLECAPENEAINKTKAANVRRAMYLLIVIVFLLLLARAVAGFG
jgi:hypothetical protein